MLLAYVTAMAAALLRILMLVALALMPLGMTGARGRGSAFACAVAGHCDDHQKPVDAPAKMERALRDLRGIACRTANRRRAGSSARAAEAREGSERSVRH